MTYPQAVGQGFPYLRPSLATATGLRLRDLSKTWVYHDHSTKSAKKQKLHFADALATKIGL